MYRDKGRVWYAEWYGCDVGLLICVTSPLLHVLMLLAGIACVNSSQINLLQAWSYIPDIARDAECLHCLLIAQITLLASGRLIYYGETNGMVPWLSELGYVYDPAINGVPSDWALDLVAINFEKPKVRGAGWP